MVQTLSLRWGVGGTGDRTTELKDLIAGVDLSDPFSRMDHARWQSELKHLLERGERNRANKWAKRKRRASPTASPPSQRPQSEIHRSSNDKPVGSVPDVQIQPARPKPSGVGIGGAKPTERALPPKKKPLPAPVPIPGSLVWCKRLWIPTQRWCEELLKGMPNYQSDKQRRKDRPRNYVRGQFEILLGLVHSVLAAGSPSDLHQAQSIVVKYKREHMHLKDVPIPNPLPIVTKAVIPSSGHRQRSDRVGPNLSSETMARSGGGFPPGESFASYNRLPLVGRGRSFDDSVALRQSSKRVRRALVDLVDRISASGGEDEYADLD